MYEKEELPATNHEEKQLKKLEHEVKAEMIQSFY